MNEVDINGRLIVRCVAAVQITLIERKMKELEDEIKKLNKILNCVSDDSPIDCSIDLLSKD